MLLKLLCTVRISVLCCGFHTHVGILTPDWQGKYQCVLSRLYLNKYKLYGHGLNSKNDSLNKIQDNRLHVTIYNPVDSHPDK